jgi:ankyrin repeat protein
MLQRVSEYYDACTARDAPALRELLAADASFVKERHPVHGGTGLHAACKARGKRGTLECVGALVESGVELDAQSSNGATALHWAAGNGDAAAVRFLLESGADPEVRSFTWGRQVFGKASGQMPVHWAAESGEAAVVELLLDAAPMSLLEVDEREASVAMVAEKNLQFGVGEMLKRRLEEDEYVVLEIEEEMAASKLL